MKKIAIKLTNAAMVIENKIFFLKVLFSSNLTLFNNFNKYDFILLRDFFIHLPSQSIQKILFNLKNSDCKYFAFNNYESVKINKDIPTGQHRKINVLNKPFNFETPYFKILELKNNNFPDKNLDDNFIYIYKNNP